MILIAVSLAFFIGEWLAEKKKIYEQLHPETKREATLKQYRNDRLMEREEQLRTDNLTVRKEIPSFVSDTAAKTGLSERTIQRAIQIAENLMF